MRIFSLWLVSTVWLASSFTAQPLRFGRAAVDITPPPNKPFQVPQRPPFPVIVGTGTHDPLHAKAVLFESGGVKAAIVSCDMTSIPADIGYPDGGRPFEVRAAASGKCAAYVEGPRRIGRRHVRTR